MTQSENTYANSQNQSMNQEIIDISPKLAGFWVRAAALFIDAMILLIPVLVAVRVPFASLLIGLLYKPVFESSFLRATPGKAVMNLKVQTIAGQQINFKTALIRYALSTLSAALLCLGYFISVFTKRRQTFHDMVLDLVVVCEPSPDVNYFKVWLERVKQLTNSEKSFQNASQGDARNTGYDTSTSSTSSTGSGYERHTKTERDVEPIDVERGKSGEKVKLLQELYTLYTAGVITLEDYEKKKAEILSRI